MADSTVWAPVVASGITGALTILGGWLAQWMTAGRESREREHEAAEQDKRQRRDFQIKTLLELQEAVHGLLQQGFKLNEIDGLTTLNRVSIDDTEIRAECEKWQLAHAKMTVLSVRVNDERIRNGVVEFGDALAKLSSSFLKRLAERGLDQAMGEVADIRQKVLDVFNSLNRQIGEAVRELY